MPVWFRREKSRQVPNQNRKQENGCHVGEEQKPKPGLLLMFVDEDMSKVQRPWRESRTSTSTTTLIFHGSSAGRRRGGYASLRSAFRDPLQLQLDVVHTLEALVGIFGETGFHDAVEGRRRHGLDS